jgi:hypothetical protein
MNAAWNLQLYHLVNKTKKFRARLKFSKSFDTGYSEKGCLPRTIEEILRGIWLTGGK